MLSARCSLMFMLMLARHAVDLRRRVSVLECLNVRMVSEQMMMWHAFGNDLPIDVESA